MAQKGKYEAQRDDGHEVLVVYPNELQLLKLIPIMDVHGSDIPVVTVKEELFRDAGLPGFQDYDMLFISGDSKINTVDSDVITDYFDYLCEDYHIEFHLRNESQRQ